MSTEEGFSVNENRLADMTPAEAWEGFVGSQTVKEFLEVSHAKGFTTIDAAVAAYIKDIPVMFDRTYSRGELYTIEACLRAYIRKNLPA